MQTSCFWGRHSWGFPQTVGRRDREGRFVVTGSTFQNCTRCGMRREYLLLTPAGRRPKSAMKPGFALHLSNLLRGFHG